MGDEQMQLTELKHFLEDWREIVVLTKHVLLWEKQWHSTAILGANTIIFTLFCLVDPGILPTIAMLGLLLTIGDFIILNLAPSLYKPDRWTPAKDKEFDAICTYLINYKNKLQQVCSSYYKLKTTNTKMYFTITLASLLTLAWIGSTFNNYLLLYVTVTTLMLTPGIKHHGMLNKWSLAINKTTQNLVSQVKSNVGESKKHN